MAVTFIKKGKAALAALNSQKPELTQKSTPRLKRLETIKDARQFTVMVTPERKVHLKMLAVQRHVTLLTIANGALAAFLAVPPESKHPTFYIASWPPPTPYGPWPKSTV